MDYQGTKAPRQDIPERVNQLARAVVDSAFTVSSQAWARLIRKRLWGETKGVALDYLSISPRRLLDMVSNTSPYKSLLSWCLGGENRDASAKTKDLLEHRGLAL